MEIFPIYIFHNASHYYSGYEVWIQLVRFCIRACLFVERNALSKTKDESGSVTSNSVGAASCAVCCSFQSHLSMGHISHGIFIAYGDVFQQQESVAGSAPSATFMGISNPCLSAQVELGNKRTSFHRCLFILSTPVMGFMNRSLVTRVLGID